ncbi:MAG TPA: lmo0937 family membrane protein [Chloroflexota bacterium]|nr:lmo0937 family membrane protein [Chloroflexota bacterium]
MLWIIAAVLIIFWIIGLAVHVLGAAIHILLVIAIIAFIVGFVLRRA